MSERNGPALSRDFFLGPDGWPYLLVPFIPLAVVLEIAHVSATVIFVVAAIGIIPTAALMGRATEELAERSGPGIGGLLNVTFGNAPELIIALFALGAGLHEVVKASIIGSIIGNVLLVMGAAMVAGGVGRPGQVQTFDRTAASAQSTMLFLAGAAMLMPAIFEMVEGKGLPSPNDEIVQYGSTVENLSLAVGVVLICCYVAGLVFSLRTHRDVFNPQGAEGDEEADDGADGAESPVWRPRLRGRHPNHGDWERQTDSPTGRSDQEPGTPRNGKPEPARQHVRPQQSNCGGETGREPHGRGCGCRLPGWPAAHHPTCWRKQSANLPEYSAAGCRQ